MDKYAQEASESNRTFPKGILEFAAGRKHTKDSLINLTMPVQQHFLQTV